MRIPLAIEKSDYLLLEKSLAIQNSRSTRSQNILNSLVNDNKAFSSELSHQKCDLPSLQKLDSWAHFALLNLISTKKFKNDSRWIAQNLRISISTATQTFTDLVKLKLIHKVDNRWTATKERIKFPNEKTHHSTRKYHQMMIEKSLTVMNNDIIDSESLRRKIIGATFAIDPDKLESLMQKMNDFLYEAIGTLSTGECTEVYQMNLLLVPLSKDHNEQ